MIIASLTRFALGKPGWSYREFGDMEEFLEWLLDAPEKEPYIHRVTEFRAGEPHEVTNWHAQFQSMQADASADRQHRVLFTGGPL